MFRFSIIVLFCLGVTGCNEDEVSTSSGTGASNYSVQTDNSISNDRLKKCPDCEKDVSKRAVSCPHCGAPFRTDSVNGTNSSASHATTGLQSNPKLPRSGGSTSFEELSHRIVSAFKSQDPENLVAISYFPSVEDWNQFVVERTDELKQDPDTALVAARARRENTLDGQTHTSLFERQENALYVALKDLPSLRHSNYIAGSVTNGIATNHFSLIDSMTFRIKMDGWSFWGQDRLFATVFVSIENVLVSIQFVACVDGDKKWWLCSDKFVVQFATVTSLQSRIKANKYEIPHGGGVRDNTEAINKATMFLAAHPTPPTRWKLFNDAPKSFRRLIKVTGTVTYDGKPLTDATVAIMPDGGDGTAKPADGKTDKNGNFTLVTTFPDGEIVDGSFEGDYTVRVVKYEAMEMPTDEGEPPADGADPAAEMMALFDDELGFIPPKSLINEKFGLAYSIDSDWDNSCVVVGPLTTFTVMLNSQGTGRIVSRKK
jgi:hypothetical protein